MSEESKDYWEHVDRIAEEALELSEDERYDRIHEDVDNSQYVIYTGRNLDVIEFTDNRDAVDEAMDEGIFDWDHLKGKSFSEALAVFAFFMMKADVEGRVEELEKEKD